MNFFDMTWPQIDRLSRDLPVVIPIAAVEQHGHHLPVGTDSLLLGEIVRRAHEVLGEQVLVTPLMWLGNSHHHLDFPGTLSAEPRVYLDLLNGLVQNLLTHGFRRILLLNGHGGNTTPSAQVIFELRQQHRQRNDLLLLAATYWESADPTTAAAEWVQRSMGHACEWETSMITRLAPLLVQGEPSQIADVPFGGAFAPAYRGWLTRDRTVAGHIGSPAAADAEKGELLFAAFSAGVVRLVQQMIAWDGTTWESSDA